MVNMCQRSRLPFPLQGSTQTLLGASYGSPGELLLLRVPATPAVLSLALQYGGNFLANWIHKAVDSDLSHSHTQSNSFKFKSILDSYDIHTRILASNKVMHEVGNKLLPLLFQTFFHLACFHRLGCQTVIFLVTVLQHFLHRDLPLHLMLVWQTPMMP